MSDLAPLIWAAIIYAVVELALDVIKKTPLWLLRQLLGTGRRLLSELSYLHALINDSDLKCWADKYVTLQAINACPAKDKAEPRPLLSLLQSHVDQDQRVMVLGEPGAGKTTSLEALTYRLARRAYWRRVSIWVFFLGVILLLLALSRFPLLALLLLVIPFFDFLFRRWPLPVLIELRRYKGGAVEDFVREGVAERVGGQALSEVLRSYMGRGRLVWLLDGVNEVPGEAYEVALDGWRECFKPGRCLADAPVIFTSRMGENPADQLGLEEVLEILDLDNIGVRDFLHAYGSRDVVGDFAILERNNMLGERGLGRNPYWLLMMLESGLYTRNRGTLFEGFARRLIQRELGKEARPKISVVPVNDELEALAYLALIMADAGQVGLALDKAERELADWLKHRGLEWEPRQVLDEAEAATLMRLSRRENRAEFAHQLVQEFFAAYNLRLRLDEALRRADDPRWWETLLMLGGLVGDHPALVQAVLGDGRDDHRIFLAVGLLRSVDESEEELEQQVTAALIESLRRGVSPRQKQAAVELVKIAGDEAVEALGGLLQEEDRTVKEGAVEILGEVGSKKAAQVLAAYLGDDAVAGPVAEAMVSIGEPAVEPLIGALRETRMRDTAVEALGRIGGPAVDSLIAVLRDGDWPMRRTVAKALSEIGEPAVAPLIAALRDGPWLVRWAVAEALGRIGDSRAVEPLARALRDGCKDVRQEAARSLEKMGDPRAIGALLGALGDEDGEVRWRAAGTLGHIRDAQAVEPLIRALRDEDGKVRWRAAHALGRIGDARAVGALMAALWDKDSRVRQAAARALGEIGDARAVGGLVAVLRDPDLWMRERAADALWQIGDPAVGPLITALGDDDGEVRQAAAEALGQIGKPALAALIEAMRDKDLFVRWAAAKLLGRIGDPQAVGPLIWALRDRDGGMRGRAAEALGQIGDVRAVEPLIEALRDEHSEVRWRAASALGRISDARAAESLITALEDENSWVRQAAAEALGWIEDLGAVQHLGRVAREDTAGEASDAAREAMERIRAAQQ